MKSLLFSTLLLFTLPIFGQVDTLTASKAKDYVGKEVVVKDVIAGARLFDRPGKKTFLINLAEQYPNTPLTIVIYDQNYMALNPKDNLEGKTIVVKGKVVLYNNKPQIVITDNSNIKLN